MKKRKISWEEFDTALEFIVDAIKDKGWVFSHVIAIPRGGLTLGVCLSNLFGKPLVVWDSDYEYDFKDQKVLLVDEIADTGQTLFKVLSELGVDRCHTVTIHRKDKSIVNPNIVYESFVGDVWIIYPWECENLKKGSKDEHKSKEGN